MSPKKLRGPIFVRSPQDPADCEVNFGSTDNSTESPMPARRPSNPDSSQDASTTAVSCAPPHTIKSDTILLPSTPGHANASTPFFKLPGEIRNEIYIFSFHCDSCAPEEIITNEIGLRFCPPHIFYRPFFTPSSANTCRVMRAECRSLLCPQEVLVYDKPSRKYLPLENVEFIELDASLGQCKRWESQTHATVKEAKRYWQDPLDMFEFRYECVLIVSWDRRVGLRPMRMVAIKR